jgi:hypothetical protein
MDWKTEITKLVDDGVSIKEIAEETGLAVSSVYDLRNGYSIEPRGMAAVKLHAMIAARKGASRKKKVA